MEVIEKMELNSLEGSTGRCDMVKVSRNSDYIFNKWSSTGTGSWRGFTVSGLRHFQNSLNKALSNIELVVR